MKDLSEIRVEIDAIDRQIFDLFARRLELVQEVAAYKMANGKPVFDPEREREKLEDVKSHIDDAELAEAVGELLSCMMSISKKKQHSIIDRAR